MKKSHIGTNVVYRYLYTCVLYSLALFFFPLSLLFSLNLRLVLALKRGKRQWLLLQQNQRREQYLTIIPLTIVLVFFVCATPSLGVNVADSVWPKLFADHHYSSYVVVANFLVVLNSASNIVIYCLLGRKFRSKVREILTCARSGGARARLNGVSTLATSRYTVAAGLDKTGRQSAAAFKMRSVHATI